MVWS